MLNPSRVLKYIKDNLAFPYQFIELGDDDIIEYVQNYTLREFSQYFPDKVSVGLNLQLPVNKVPGRANEFYLTDEQGLEILDVVGVYFSSANFMMH